MRPQRRRTPLTTPVELHHVIDGELVDSIDGRRFDSVNPTTQEVWATAPRGATADADRAVTAARRAFDDGPWPRMSPDERSACLHRLADLIVEHDSSPASTPSTWASRSPRPVRRTSRERQNFRFFADYARLAENESYPVATSHHMYTRYEPVGDRDLAVELPR
ncbi:MAG: aldehyde dehydrogenase family protein [Ilumatobacteraceae bacterium]